jgi:YgiT-type zinc finger domain-containing protein
LEKAIKKYLKTLMYDSLTQAPAFYILRSMDYEVMTSVSVPRIILPQAHRAMSAKAKTMTCVICRTSETRSAKVSVTLERDGTTSVIKSVPASVCENCGEEYVDEETTARLLKTAAEAIRAGA